MARDPRNGFLNLSMNMEVDLDAFGIMELDASLEDLTNLAKLLIAVIHPK